MPTFQLLAMVQERNVLRILGIHHSGVCVCVCMRVCMCTCVYDCTCRCMHVYVCAPVHFTCVLQILTCHFLFSYGLTSVFTLLHHLVISRPCNNILNYNFFT